MMKNSRVQQGDLPVPEDMHLWRYIPITTLFHYLEGRVFVPSIETLQNEDPSEGLEYFDEVWAMEGFNDSERNELLEWHIKGLNDNERKLFEHNRADPKVAQREWQQRYYRFLEKTRFAWCFFSRANESAAMWKLYGQAGAAIRTSLRSLSPILENAGVDWLVSGVKYVDRNCGPEHSWGWGESEIRPFARRPFLLKRKEYEHEKEVRIVASSDSRGPGILLENLSNEWIQEIVLWPRMHATEANTLIRLIHKVYPLLNVESRSSRLYERDPTDVGADSASKEAESRLFDDIFPKPFQSEQRIFSLP